MRLRILDRILVAVAGLLILAVCAGILAQVFFHVDVVDKIAKVLTTDKGWVRAAIAVACILLMLIGCYCVLVLFRHRRRKDRFIMQKMESGELAISLKAMETMVSRCLEQRKEIEPQSVRLENQRDGLVIRIRGTVASGISIPLTVDTLQKQIKQYVTACSGVEVKGIRVQIESSGDEATNAPFAIDAPAPTPLLQSAEKAKEETPAAEPEKTGEKTAAEPEKVPAPAPVIPSAAESAIEAVENLKKEHEEEFEDDRPIHQRLFSTPEEPCIMPLPPENLMAEGPAEEELPDAAETAGMEIVEEELTDAAETVGAAIAEEKLPAADENCSTAPAEGTVGPEDETAPDEDEKANDSGTEDKWKYE